MAIEISDVDKFLQKSPELSSIITISAKQNRKLMENELGNVIVARNALKAVILSLFEKYDDIKGKPVKNKSEFLTLICSFIQGIDLVEKSIADGQYIKASALLKQDYEIVTRINEFKKGVAVAGKTPNVKHAPKNTQIFYGEIMILHTLRNSNNCKIIY